MLIPHKSMLTQFQTRTQAVKTTDTVQDDKQAQLTASSTDQTKTDDTAKADNVSSTAEKALYQQLILVQHNQYRRLLLYCHKSGSCLNG